ncbi:hypothetical protein [Nonomuraea sp. JJY05]
MDGGGDRVEGVVAVEQLTRFWTVGEKGVVSRAPVGSSAKITGAW